MVYHCQKKVPTWTLISGSSHSGKSNYGRSLANGNLVQLDWLLAGSIANSMHKGNPIISEFSKLIKANPDIARAVRWINSDAIAAAMADHVIKHLPLESDLIIEGYLLSNKHFMRHFLPMADDLSVRIWHSQKIST